MKFFQNMKLCQKCISPETFPGITFDQEGVCNYCRSWEMIKVLGEEKLKEKLQFFQNKGEKYDVLVPISGGRDSSFVIYNIVKKYNTRVLALTVDSGFITDAGYRNIAKITSVLNITHFWIKNERKNKISKKNCKLKFHGWLEKPSIHTIVPVLNSGDKTMNFQIFKYAQKNKIPLVIGGNNIGNSIFEQEHWKTGFLGIFPDIRGYYSRSDKLKLLMLLGREYLKNTANFKFSILEEYLEGLFVYFFESIVKPSNIETLGFYDYIYWNEMEIISTIKEELGWLSAEDASTTWRIDDSAYPLINYIYYNLVGFSEHDEMYSKMIREGQISREEALRRAKEDHKPRIPSLMKLLKELKVEKEYLDYVLEKYSKKLLKKILN